MTPWNAPRCERPISWDAFASYKWGSRQVVKSQWPYQPDSWSLENLWLLYTLRAPSSPKIHYVGITRNMPHVRYISHVRGRGSKAKSAWIGEMRKRGCVPVMEIVGSLRGSLRDAISTETILSKALLNEGHPIINREVRFS